MNIYMIVEEVGSYDDTTRNIIFCDYCHEDALIAWEVIWDSIMLNRVMGTHDAYVINKIRYGNNSIITMQSLWYHSGELNHYEVYSMKPNNLFGDVEDYNWATYYKELRVMSDDFVTYNPVSRLDEGYNPYIASVVGYYLKFEYGFVKRRREVIDNVNNYLSTMNIIG